MQSNWCVRRKYGAFFPSFWMMLGRGETLTGAALSFLGTYTENSVLTKVIGRVVMSLRGIGRFEVVCQEAHDSSIVKRVRELELGFVIGHDESMKGFCI